MLSEVLSRIEALTSSRAPEQNLHLLTLRLKIAQKPFVIWSLGPKTSKYESLEPEGNGIRIRLDGFPPCWQASSAQYLPSGIFQNYLAQNSQCPKGESMDSRAGILEVQEMPCIIHMLTLVFRCFSNFEAPGACQPLP